MINFYSLNTRSVLVNGLSNFSPGAVDVSRSQLLLGGPVHRHLLPAVGGEPHLRVRHHLGAGGGGGEVPVRHPNLYQYGVDKARLVLVVDGIPPTHPPTCYLEIALNVSSKDPKEDWITWFSSK